MSAASSATEPFLVSSSPEDHELLQAVGRGEQAALGELFERYHLSVYRFLARLSGTDARDLDDLVQNTFLEVQRAASGYGGRASVRTWLFGVAANVARHHVRSEMRRRSMLASVDQPGVSEGRPPERAAESRELLGRLAQALDALPHDLRVAFIACELEELPGAEVAHALGIREGTLWRRLHDARKALLCKLEGSSP